MKTIFTILILTLSFGGFASAKTLNNQQIKLRVNQQKAVSGGKIKIKFLSLVEDSRCPENVNCIHAGNGKIQIRISGAKNAARTFEINTDLQPSAVSYEGFEIKLTNLEPKPKENIRINKNGYTATFAVSKIRK